MVDRLVSEYAPREVILFGSHAYGTVDVDSDIDLLVMTPEEVKGRLAKGDHFVEDIASNGHCLYGEATWKRFRVSMSEGEASYAMAWLTNSERDLRRARLLMADDDAGGAGLPPGASAAKGLKAFLLYNVWSLQRTRDLETLLDAALEYDAEMESMRHLFRRVSAYHMTDRYPDSSVAVPGVAEVGERLSVIEPLVAGSGTLSETGLRQMPYVVEQ